RAKGWRSVHRPDRGRHEGRRKTKHTTMTRDVKGQLDDLLAARILVLDGAMGTMVQRCRLSEADFRGERFAHHPNDLRGDNGVLAGSDEQYLAAGSDIIETTTFTGTAVSQADYALEGVAYELNLAGARLARAAADAWTARTPGKPRFVAGSIGPMNKTLSISPD